MEEDKNKLEYSVDTKGKFLLFRHGETLYNIDKDQEAGKVNPTYADCPLTEKGVNQAKEKQSVINEMDIEAVYVSPYYRALETITNAIENHKNLENIKIFVHPFIGELLNSVSDYVLDIEYTKKIFNMNSKVKIDWSLFDEYVKGIKYDENFYYFEFINCLADEEKQSLYEKLNSIYKKKEIDLLRKELANLAQIRLDRKRRLESLKHGYERFMKFNDFILEKHRDTLNNDNRKILIIAHGALSRVLTSKKLYTSDEIQDHYKEKYNMKNCEIISIYLK